MDLFNQLASGLGEFLAGPSQDHQGNQDGFPTHFAQGPRGHFSATYTCYAIAFAGKDHLEEGNKMLLPPSALDALTRMNIEFPMMFQVTNPTTGQLTHAGVMEFSAPEGLVYMPYWMMQNLLLENEASVVVRNVSLPKGNFVRFQPHETKFTELSNPKAVLEKSLRMFACLTKGDTITIQYGPNSFYIDVTEVKPGSAISVTETDVNVEFDPPKDYVEPAAAPVQEEKTPVEIPANSPVAIRNSGQFATPQNQENTQEDKVSSYFSNLSTGYRLSDSSPVASSSSAKQPTCNSNESESSGTKTVRETSGKFEYIYHVDAKTGAKRLIRRLPVRSKASSSGFSAFQGKGHSLK